MPFQAEVLLAGYTWHSCPFQVTPHLIDFSDNNGNPAYSCMKIL